MALAEKIREQRLKKELTQEELAQKAGIPYVTLVKIERESVKNPTIDTIKKIAKALEISLDELIYNDK